MAVVGSTVTETVVLSRTVVVSEVVVCNENVVEVRVWVLKTKVVVKIVVGRKGNSREQNLNARALFLNGRKNENGNRWHTGCCCCCRR
jgi:hypothetical protein